MSTHHYDPRQHPEVQQGTVLRYVAATVISGLAMVGAYYIALSKPPLVELLEGLAGTLLVALLAQAALYFGLDISRAQIWKSVSLVLTLPLFIISIGITVWAFSSLYNRTMPDPSILSSMAM
jgi:cytochrome o ubiquinol oxidase operon protein cyoD